MSGILRASHSADDITGAQLFGSDAGYDIGLVIRCDSDKYIAVVHSRLHLHVQEGSAAGYAGDIDGHNQSVDLLFIAVDHDNIMLLAAEVTSEHFTDLTQAGDDNLHVLLLI